MSHCKYAYRQMYVHFRICYNLLMSLEGRRSQNVIIIALQPFVGPWPLFQFLDPIRSVGLLGRGISPLQSSTYTQNNTNTE
jgi:hypothetical protein